MQVPLIIDDTYQTIKSSSTGFYKNKGSKFLGFGYPVTTSLEVKSILSDTKSTYYDARHHCYAYRLGQYGDVWRANDDGEPNGTAAKPIMGQLKSFNLTNIFIVVVRYFGGTKLGTTGLIQAYKQTTIDTINNAQIITNTIMKSYVLRFEYALMSSIMRFLKSFSANITSQVIDNPTEITLDIRLSECLDFEFQASKIPHLTISPQTNLNYSIIEQ